VNRKYTSRIAAVCHVSESEIVAYEDLMYGESSTVLPIEINSVLEDTYWLTILFRLGIDTNLPFEYQGVSQHRNRLNEIVTCGRWDGVERYDKEWLESGVASKEAIDRAANNPFLDELYRHRGLTIDAQYAGDERDKYIVEEEEDEQF
jgi:hypothetical protein